MPRLAFASLGAIAIADCVIHRRSPSWFAIGPLDHAAHLATAALLLPRGRSLGWTVSFMAGSLLPDLDHVPLAFRDPKPGDPRPPSHSLLSVAPAAAASRATAAGMLAHLARDLALAPGAPVLWPLSSRQLRVPYAVYAAAVTALAARALLRGSRAR